MIDYTGVNNVKMHLLYQLRYYEHNVKFVTGTFRSLDKSD